jgi:hypothetical protein
MYHIYIYVSHTYIYKHIFEPFYRYLPWIFKKHGSRNLGACGWSLEEGELKALQEAAKKAPKTQSPGRMWL